MILAVPVGMIVFNLYKAGAFDYILDDVRILARGNSVLAGTIVSGKYEVSDGGFSIQL